MISDLFQHQDYSSHSRKTASDLLGFHNLCISCPLFSKQSETEITYFLMFNSHFKYLFSSHHKDTYQIISYKDIPNLFHCWVTSCSVIDPLSSHKCLDSRGWTLRFPSRPVQPLPDVCSLSQMLLIFSGRTAIRVQNCLSHKRSFFCFRQNREHSPSEAAQVRVQLNTHLQQVPTLARVLVLDLCLTWRRS